jgi:putative ABC transport system ATP-binding protein
MASLIRLEEVSRSYRTGDAEVAALRSVSLTIDPGEFVAIAGPSGSGKSTMLGILGCLDRATQGRYFLEGTEVSRLGDDALADLRNRCLGFVFQQFHLLARATALENVELPLVYAGVVPGDRRARATLALDRVGLGNRRDHLPNQLSGGQQQRVAIARAIVTRPRLLLADEPTGNLDSSTSNEVMTMLEELAREGMTIIVVTHEAAVAARARRTVVIRDGVIASDRAEGPQSRRAHDALAARRARW